MELRIHHFLIGVALCGPMVRADAPKSACWFPLNERVVYEIPISEDAPTTLTFPSPLTAIEGANVETSPEQGGAVLLSYTAGRNFFTLRGATAEAKGALNVIWQGKTYALRLFASAQPFRSVIFYESAPVQAKNLWFAPGESRLWELMSTAKRYPLLTKAYSDAQLGLDHRVTTDLSSHSDYRVRVAEVFRFDKDDVLVFRVVVGNFSRAAITFDLPAISVRVGRTLYHAASVDFPAIVPGGFQAIGYFAITGTPTGERANLSVENAFDVIVPLGAAPYVSGNAGGQR